VPSDPKVVITVRRWRPKSRTRSRLGGSNSAARSQNDADRFAGRDRHRPSDVEIGLAVGLGRWMSGQDGQEIADLT